MQAQERKPERGVRGSARDRRVLRQTSFEQLAWLEQGATYKIDGYLAMVLSVAPKVWEIGCAFVLPSGIERTESDDQIAQGGEILGSVPGTDRRLIFAEGDIPHVVDTFDRPVAAPEGLQLSGVHLGGWATAEHDFGFFGDAEGFEMVSRAANDSGLDGVGKAGLLGSDLKGIDLAGFMSAVALVQRDVRREKKRLSAPWQSGRVCGRAWVDCL